MARHTDARLRTMVRRHLAARDIHDRRVLAAMAATPRHLFVPSHLQASAYDDAPLPIGKGQTISQPYIVALMTQHACLTRHARVLDVGTGSGYQAAVLARIARHVWSIERISELSHDACERLRGLGLRNVTFLVGDGAMGCPAEAPFDAIVVAAAAPKPPAALLDQLAPGGRLVIPLGDRVLQELTVMERVDRGVRTHTAGACRFVPLVSAAAFDEEW